MKTIKKTFTVMGHKVSIKELSDGKWEGTISCPHDGGNFRVVCDDIHGIKSELHELANNNDCGRAISEKIHDWYFSEIGSEQN